MLMDHWRSLGITLEVASESCAQPAHHACSYNVVPQSQGFCGMILSEPLLIGQWV